MKVFLKYFTLFSIGALLYMWIETWYKASYGAVTHWSMGLVGGICFILIGLIDNTYEMPLYKQMFVGAIIITSCEFISGVIVNMWLGLNVWDYGSFKFNILGQVCLEFFFIWYFISLPAILLDDFIRAFIFGEPYKHYTFFRDKNHAMHALKKKV